MSDHTPRRSEADSAEKCEDRDRPEVRTQPRVADAIAETADYETEKGVVLYDVENPLAWVESDSALDVAEMV